MSTTDQHCENQLVELRRYCEARGWTITKEFVDVGVSGAEERRPALDDLVRDAKRRRLDVLVVWRLDRLGRNLRHLILLLDDLQATGVAFVSLSEERPTFALSRAPLRPAITDGRRDGSSARLDDRT